MPIGLSQEYYELYQYLVSTKSLTTTWLRRGFGKSKKSGTVSNYIAFLKSLCYFFGFSELKNAKKEDLLKPEQELRKRIVVERDMYQSKRNAIRIIQQYVDWQNEIGFAANTAIGRYGLLCEYIRALEYAEIHSDDVKRDIAGLPKRGQARDIPLNHEDVRLIVSHAQYWHKRRLLAMLSSGMNPIDLVSLRVRNIHFDEGPIRITSIRAKTGTNIESFFTKEAWEYVKRGVDWNNPLAFVFNNEKRYESISDDEYQRTVALKESANLSGAFHKLILSIAEKDVEFGRKNIYSVRKLAVTGRNMLSISLRTLTRKFFLSWATKAVGVDHATARTWMGHSEYWQTYSRKPLEERQSLYRAAEKYLTIFAEPTDLIAERIAQTLINIEMMPFLSDQEKDEMKKRLQQQPIKTQQELMEFVRQEFKTFKTKYTSLEDFTDHLEKEHNPNDVVRNVQADPKNDEIKYTLEERFSKARVQVKAEELQMFMDNGYEPILELKSGDFVMRRVEPLKDKITDER